MDAYAIPARRKLYYKRGIIDVLIGKGEYLLKEKKRLFLVKDEKREEVLFIKIDYNKLLNGWEFANYSKDKLWLISLDLRGKQLSLSLGKIIENTLGRLNEEGIKFRLSRPLPLCIFQEKDAIIKKYRIPLNCEDCLELFIVNKDGTDNLYCYYRMHHFVFFKKGRYQLVELWKTLFGIHRLKRCSTCRKEEECKFWLWRVNCYNNIHDIVEESQKFQALNGWKQKQFQKTLIPWWFLQNKWKINSDISIWQRLFRYRLKDEWIIDAGGAYGRNSFGFYKISKKTVLVDIGRDFFEYTLQYQEQKRVNFPIINADVIQLPFKNSSIGMIYSGGVLHAMPQKEKIEHLKECYRMLKPSGLFIGIVMAEYEVGKPRALWPITYKKDLVYLLKSVGFDFVWVINKFTFKGEAYQVWYFLAIKNAKIKKIRKYDNTFILDKNCLLGSNCSTVPLFYKRRLLALYNLQKEKHYMLGTLSVKLWSLLAQHNIEGIFSYLKKRPDEERKYIEKELENLIKEGFLDLYRR